MRNLVLVLETDLHTYVFKGHSPEDAETQPQRMGLGPLISLFGQSFKMLQKHVLDVFFHKK